MALVFPCVILTMTMSGGAMGGGVASAIARALGAGDRRARLDACGACAADRLLLRAGLHAGHADLRPAPARIARRPRQRAGAGDRAISQIFFGGAVLPWLMNTHGRDSARHRQHEVAVAADSLLRRLPDHSGRHARARPWADAAIRHARRRGRVADRLHDQHFRHGLVSVLRTGARGSQDHAACAFNGRCSSTS